MTSVNQTLYIPLYGKACATEKGIVLNDPKAAEIWKSCGLRLSGKAANKYLCYYMAMRARVIDDLVLTAVEKLPNAAVLHLGCGLDSRVLRLNVQNNWYDVDFAEVIDERKKHYSETDRYAMVSADVRDPGFLQSIDSKDAVIVMEGITMYLDQTALQNLLMQFDQHFDRIILIADFYTEFSAKASKYKNPVNEVGVTKLYGYDDMDTLCAGTLLRAVSEYDMTPPHLENELSGLEKMIFKSLYGGKFADRLYRLYSFEKA